MGDGMTTRINGETGINRVQPGAVGKEDLDWVPPFTKEYNSAAQAMVNSALLTFAHGLGTEPKSVLIIAQCKTADAGYVPGERIILSPGAGISGINGIQPAVRVDATNVLVRCSSNGFPYLNATASGAATLVHANWDLFVRAQA